MQFRFINLFAALFCTGSVIGDVIRSEYDFFFWANLVLGAVNYLLYFRPLDGSRNRKPDVYSDL